MFVFFLLILQILIEVVAQWTMFNCKRVGCRFNFSLNIFINFFNGRQNAVIEYRGATHNITKIERSVLDLGTYTYPATCGIQRESK